MNISLTVKNRLHGQCSCGVIAMWRARAAGGNVESRS